MNKLPKELAQLLAELHDKVMEVHDRFETWKSDLYCGVSEEDYETFLKGFDLDKLEAEVEYVCDKLEDLEAETSELDNEYNNYE